MHADTSLLATHVSTALCRNIIEEIEVLMENIFGWLCIQSLFGSGMATPTRGATT